MSLLTDTDISKQFWSVVVLSNLFPPNISSSKMVQKLNKIRKGRLIYTDFN